MTKHMIKLLKDSIEWRKKLLKNEPDHPNAILFELELRELEEKLRVG